VNSFAWWAQLGSNQRPLACKASALTTELCTHAVTPVAGSIGHDRASVPVLGAASSQREPEETSLIWRLADPGGAAVPAKNLGQRELNLLSQPRRHTEI
jgi:hypothetical protein